jgi:hypothetical protein
MNNRHEFLPEECGLTNFEEECKILLFTGFHRRSKLLKDVPWRKFEFNSKFIGMKCEILISI